MEFHHDKQDIPDNFANNVYARMVTRFMSFIIDVVFIYFSIIILTFPFNELRNALNIQIIALCYSLVYFTYCWIRCDGKTIGAEILGIKVKSFVSSKISFGLAFLRAGMLTMILAPIGYTMFVAIYNIFASIFLLFISPTKERRQTVWDMACKTVVVKINRAKSGDNALKKST